MNFVKPLHHSSRGTLKCLSCDLSSNAFYIQSHFSKQGCVLNLSDVQRIFNSALSQTSYCLESVGSIRSYKSTPPSWRTSHKSSSSFFENVHGVPASFVRLNTLLPFHTSQLIRSLTRETVNKFSHRRFFKTHRSSKEDQGSHVEAESRLLKFLPRVLSRKNVQVGSIRSNTSVNPETPRDKEMHVNGFLAGYDIGRAASNENEEGFITRVFRTAMEHLSVILFLVVFLVTIIGLAFSRVAKGLSEGNISGGIGGLSLGRMSESAEVEYDVGVRFTDVKGVDEAKKELVDVVEFLKNPKKFTVLGAELPRGVLLVGPPGTGKTLLARAVAGEAGVPFFHMSGSSFDEIFVGSGAKRVRSLFESARKKAPCVIFLDEIDSVGAKRTSSQMHPYANQTINQLLAEMDGFSKREGVIVLGATNKVGNLDPALLRAGRFDVQVTVAPPDYKGRLEILQLYLSTIKQDKDKINVKKLAHGTFAFTGAHLKNLVNQAALKAAMEGDDLVNMGHLEFARDKIIMGPERKSRIPDKLTNEITAYHEAGHALVSYFCEPIRAIHKVTIIPRSSSLGHTSFIPTKELFGQSREQLRALMSVAFGGRVAEEIVFGYEKVSTGASDDFSRATDIASSMVRDYGMSEKIGCRRIQSKEDSSEDNISNSLRELVDKEIDKLLKDAYDNTRTLLLKHRDDLEAVAKALLQYETLDGDDIEAIVQGKALKKDSDVYPSTLSSSSGNDSKNIFLENVSV